MKPAKIQELTQTKQKVNRIPSSTKYNNLEEKNISFIVPKKGIYHLDLIKYDGCIRSYKRKWLSLERLKLKLFLKQILCSVDKWKK
jgi:hypothetical protein